MVGSAVICLGTEQSQPDEGYGRHEGALAAGRRGRRLRHPRSSPPGDETPPVMKLAAKVRGLSEPAFRARFGAQEQCLMVLFEMRRGRGFTCEPEAVGRVT